jgi:MarR family transcriptional regulator, organic hydroperoxide resistance regulator
VPGDREELIKQIMQVQKQMGRYLHKDPPDAWLTLNLTIAQLKTLMFINFKGNTNFKMLARALKVSPPNVTGIVDRLLVQELVSREDNPENRRMQILQVTENGKALISELMKRADSNLYTILSIMKTADLEHLVNGMSALLSAAQQSRDEEPDCPEERLSIGK